LLSFGTFSPYINIYSVDDETRSTLKVTELDLATARSHVQQFKEISQANETALGDLNNTFDEYKASTEAQIARLEVFNLFDK
jgi:nucleoprotein TPR